MELFSRIRIHLEGFGWYKTSYKVVGTWICLLLLGTIISCRKSDSDSASTGGRALIEVSLTEVSFEREQRLESRSANGYLVDPGTISHVQRGRIDLGNGLQLISELSPVDEDKPFENIHSIRDVGRAALDNTALTADIRYKVVVYNASGLFVLERNYIRGQEASTEPLLLDGGSTYTFIVYSINSTSDNLPAVIPSTGRTLANSQISVNGSQDYMYFRQTLTVSGNSINRLNIVLKHRFCQITTTINSSQSGYTVNAVSSNFQPHNTNSLVSLTDGSFTRNGANQPAEVTFAASSLGSEIVTSLPTIINAGTNQTTTFNIASITIGTATGSNLVPIDPFTITPGVRYTYAMHITPADQYVTHQSQRSARIGNQIWMRHNLGVSTALDPDALPMTVSRHGNYYQWGRSAVIAGPTATSISSASWNGNVPPNNAYNAGSEPYPLKSANDPCPSGFRIPTVPELQTLINNTIYSRNGTVAASNTNYGVACIMTSNRNINVRLTLPAQGSFTGSISGPGELSDRGNTGLYHASRGQDSGSGRMILGTSASAGTFTSAGSGKFISRNIRCIAINP